MAATGGKLARSKSPAWPLPDTWASSCGTAITAEAAAESGQPWCKQKNSLFSAFWDGISHWPGACQIRWDGWSASPRGLPVSSPVAVISREYHHHSWSFLDRFWGLVLQSLCLQGNCFAELSLKPLPSWQASKNSLFIVILCVYIYILNHITN